MKQNTENKPLKLNQHASLQSKKSMFNIPATFHNSLQAHGIYRVHSNHIQTLDMGAGPKQIRDMISLLQVQIQLCSLA